LFRVIISELALEEGRRKGGRSHAIGRTQNKRTKKEKDEHILVALVSQHQQRRFLKDRYRGKKEGKKKEEGEGGRLIFVAAIAWQKKKQKKPSLRILNSWFLVTVPAIDERKKKKRGGKA